VPENEPSDLIQQREKKLQAIVELGFEAYPRKYDVTRTIPQVVAENAALSAEELAAQKISVRVGGRVMTIRPHGKAGFAHLAGGGQRLQIYVRLDAVGERDFELYKLLDLGDLIGVEGYIPHPDGRADHPRRAPAISRQGDVAAAGEMARPYRCGNPLSPALP
jgi:lysyl-tRNA synthetase class II